MKNNMDLGMIAAEHIIRIADTIKAIKPVGSLISANFNFDELTVGGEKLILERLANAVDDKKVSIYSFHLGSTANRKEFLNKFESAKANRSGGLAYPRLNRPLPELSDDCLYVGTSRQTKKRLAEHLGYGSDKTYALHLGKWTEGLVGGVEVRIHEYDLADDLRSMLTHLEDALARDLRPMLGRRGNL